MRTSKKLLSFFLAVVMVITTCSVGFTAFAKDYDNIWNDSAEAKDAFESLNGLADDYLPSALMGIDAVSNVVYQKYAAEMGKKVTELTEDEKADIEGKATLQDILTALQPTLLSALGGESADEYAKRARFFGSREEHSGSYYSYLEKDDGSIDFYSLYALCCEYRNNTDLSKETRDKLSEWKTQLESIGNLAVDDASQDYIDEVVDSYVNEYEFTVYETPLYKLEADFADTLDNLRAEGKDDIAAGIESKFQPLTDDFINYGADEDFCIDSFAKYLFYTYGYGAQEKEVNKYYELVTLGGADGFSIEIKAGDSDSEELYEAESDVTVTGLTPENCAEKYYTEGFGMDYAEVLKAVVCKEMEFESFNTLTPEEQTFYSAYFGEYFNTVILLESVVPEEINYIPFIKGLAVKFGGVTTDELDARVAAKMPANYKTDPENVLTEDEVQRLASFIKMIKASNEKDISTLLRNGGTAVTLDTWNKDVAWDLPDALDGTYFAEYIAYMNDERLGRGKAAGTPTGEVAKASPYWNTFLNGIYDYQNDSQFPWNLYRNEDGTVRPITTGDATYNVNQPYVVRYEDSNFPVLNYTETTWVGDGGTEKTLTPQIHYDVIADYVADAEIYGYSQEVADILGGDVTYTRNSHTAAKVDIDYSAYYDAHTPQLEEAKPVLTEEQQAILYADYDHNLTGEVGTELTDLILNNLITSITGNDIVAGIINANLTTQVDLDAALAHIWQRVCDDPISTVFELVPVLIVLVDELLLPIIANSEGDSYNGFLDLLIEEELANAVGGLLKEFLGTAIYFTDYSLGFGSYIGIDQLGWDLNELLPDLMHWLLASKEQQRAKNVDGITYYSGETVQLYKAGDGGAKTLVSYAGKGVANADFKHYEVKDVDGNVITREETADADGNTSYNYTYKGSTGSIADVVGNSDIEFNCYTTYEASVPYLTGIYIADKALANARIDDLGKLLSKSMDETLANGLAEIIEELALLFTASIDEYVGDETLVSQARYKNGERITSGLNNLFVALPQLLDIMEDLAADKYGIAKDAWLFCYDGKITETSEGNLAGPDGTESTVNAPLETFKSYAGSSDENRSVDILDSFVTLVIEDWLNAIISLLNNIITTDNVITQNLPIIDALLNSLDGFGENSVFTDIFNGIFQLKRGDDASFEFKLRDNGFTGLSSENAYFLFANIDTLVRVIMNLVSSFSSADETSSSSLTSGAASLLNSFSQETAVPVEASAVNASSFSQEELSSVDKLITKLDEMISSLLSSSSINDYSIDNMGNIAAGVVSLLSNYISNDNAEELMSLLDSYLYYLDGAGTRAPDEDGNMKAEDVYTNENLSDLVVRTFALLEDIVCNLLESFDYVTGEGEDAKTYNLLACAINGVISPDSIGIRLDDYEDAQKEILDLTSWNSAINTDGTLKSGVKGIDWNVTNGDKDAFFDGLSSSLRLITSILGALLVDAGIYENALYPILNTIGSYTGVEVDTPEEYADAENPYRDEALLGLLNPIVSFLDKFLEAPATTLINTVEALAAILDDSNTEAGTIASIVANTVAPIRDEILGVANILNVSSIKLQAASPTLAEYIAAWVDQEITPLTEVENNQLVNLKIKDIPLCGENLIPIINAYLSGLGITLNAIDWKALSNAASPADALTYVLEYVIDTVAKSENLDAIVALIAGDGTVSDTVNSLITAIKEDRITGKGIVDVVLKILNATQNPTIFAWSFEKYLQEAIEGFSYPLGLTKTQADEAARDLDTVINNIFPLLKSLGLDIGGSTLSDILKNNLFTNKILTTLAVELYGALTSNSTVVTVLDIIGIKSSTADVAALLTDTSYGATYSAAAQAIAAKASWSELKTVTKGSDGKEKTTYADINWGFTDGAANAQQGFVNALVAILRPLNDVLAVFLNTGDLTIGTALYDLICGLEASGTMSDDASYTLAGGVFTITLVDADNSGSQPSTIKLDLTSLDALKNLLIKGTNGYNSAVIPLLEAFGCEGIVTEAQYKSDVAAAKDNLLLDILNPIAGSASNSLLNKLVEAPVVTIATILPTVSAYLDASGLSQAVVNLLAPIAEIINSVTAAVDVDGIITALLGQSLSDYVASALGMKAGSVKLEISDIASINLEDMVVPLINMLLKKYGIVLSDINWNTLTSLGDRTTYTSAATDVNGNPLTGKTVANVDYGKVLITVLRYVCDNLISNIDVIKTLIMGIVTDEKTGKKISDDATLSGILNNVFTQIKTHTSDEIIVALYYFFVGDNTDAYWDYSSYKTKATTFKYPSGVTEENVTKLVAFLDAIIEEIDLNALLNQYLYTDSIVNSLAKLIYTNIEKTKVSGSITLNDILSIFGIATDSKTVVAMLRDSRYGETKQFASAADAVEAAGSWAAVDFDKLTWGVKDKDTFLKALVAILRPFEGIIDVLVADGKLNLLGGIDIPGSNGYVNSIVPLLEAFRCDGIKSYEQYLSDKSKTYDSLLLDVLEPLFGFVDDVVATPLEAIASVLPNVALFIGNDGLVQLVVNLITPITALINDVNPIIDVDKLLQELTKISNISISNIGKFLEPYIGGGNLIALLNKYLAAVGLQIPEIDWLGLASLGTVKNEASAVKCIGQRIVVDGNSSKVIVAVLRYLLDFVLDNKTAITGLLGKSYTGTVKDILDMIFDLKTDDVLRILFSLVDITQSPTEVYWSYEKYKSQYKKFKYPNGITAEDAENAVGQLDNMVNGIFALLQGVGVLDCADLGGVLNEYLFTNEMLTQLAVDLYGALDTEKVAPYLEMLGVPVSTKDVAKLLTDKSYGKTYSGAAKKINSVSSWSKLKTVTKDKDGKENTTYAKINWGFTNGAANAEQGFVNGLTAVLRPFLNLVGPFLNGSDLALGDILYNLIVLLDINSGNKDKGETLVTLKNGLLTIQTQSNGVYSTALELNLANLKSLKKLNLYGSNGYENSIIPLLDVLQVDNKEIKSYDQYVKDCKKAKDNILLDVLNPLMSFIDKVCAAPFDTITAVLPNLAYFIDNGGVGQLLDNLLSPVTEWLKDAKKQGVDIDKIIKLAAGKDLGSLLMDLLKIKGIKFNLQLTNLTACNIGDILIPLINSLLKKTGLKLPSFDWATVASHGDVVTSKSKAENSKGKFTNKEVISDKGETLVAVLRYLADLLIKNSKALKSLLGSIDAIKKNDTIKSIINSIFNTIGTASKDEIVIAVFYFLTGEPTNAFWNYTAYQTGQYDFSYPDNINVDFLKNLGPMLDGLINGLLGDSGLVGLIGDALYKDEIISSLAVGLYGAIESVNISDGTTLTDLLAMTDIDFSIQNVSKLLVDENYGQSYPAAASVISSAGSWANVNKASLTWGVNDRDSFFHALVAVLRPIYGVLDVLLNDAYLGLFNIVRVPGSNGYTSSIVPLMEAFSMYNIKTQYQYREDIKNEYDNILLDIINPIWDWVEDVLNAPIQTIAADVPNLALFLGNDGLCQVIDNLLTPVSALIDAIKPVVDLNDLLNTLFKALNVDLNSLLGSIGITNFSLDLYDLNATLKPLLGGDALIPLINNILGLIKIGDTTLGLKLNDVDWLKLASHGETKVSASQAATYGSRIYVIGDSSETLIAVLRYLIDTVNTGDNFDMINSLIGGLLGDSADDTVSDIINSVLSVLQGETDDVIAALVDLLETIA